MPTDSASDQTYSPAGAPRSGPAADAAYRSYIDTREIPGLNGIRFFAIAAVLWHHFPWVAETFAGGHVLRYGFLGVDLFFVLSGYLITTLLLRERRAKGQFSLKAFYWRRILRILPVYYTVVLALSLYYVVLQGRWDLAGLVPYYLLFLSNFLTDHIPLLTITWSLSVEEQFYMIWPLALLLLPARLIVPALIAVITLNVVAVTGALEPLGIRPFLLGPLNIQLPTATYAPILMGALLAVVLDRPAGFASAHRLLSAPMMSPLLLIAVVAVVWAMPTNITGVPNLAIHLTMTAFLTAVVVAPRNWLSGFLNWRPVYRIGEISYGIYLYHLIALDFARRISGMITGGDSPWTYAILYVFFALAMAEISFRTLEAWFRRFRGVVQ